MTMFTMLKKLGLATVLAAAIGSSLSLGQDKGDSGDSLERGFQSPPDTAKPRVWWHWMNGNITKEGIDSDLDWMKRVGIGGFPHFHAQLNTPTGVYTHLRFFTPQAENTLLLPPPTDP